MNLHELELRLTPTPLPGWDGAIQVLSLPDGGELVAPGVGGGPHVVRTGASGDVLWSVFSHEPEFRGGVNLATADGNVYVGVGAGGGPRVVTLDLTTGSLVASVFVGDPASRTGVDAATVLPVTGVDVGVGVEQPGTRPPAGISPAANAIDGSAGTRRVSELDLGTFQMRDIGPTPYGVGLVFEVPPTSADDEIDRALLPRDVLLALATYDYYVAIGPSIAFANALPRYIEIPVGRAPYDAEAIAAAVLAAR